jgi:hypothetical protein
MLYYVQKAREKEVYKLDKRKHYVMVLDTETANTITTENGKLDMSNVLVYDCGWAVVDTKGKIYETASYVNRDIFVGERKMMLSAYYHKKIPRYVQDIRAGIRKMANTYEIRKAMLETIERWGIKEVVAHNARFDYNALNSTERWTTASKYRYWFPFGMVEVWDTMKGVSQVMCKMPTYIKFCQDNGYILKNGQPRKTAEIAYRFISGKHDFEESHTGLEDVLIEAEIFWYCLKQHKAMDLRLFPAKEKTPVTSMQKEIMHSVKINSPVK